MRPLRLRIEGLRSYRDPTEIEFPDAGDANLMAIVGDTGSGKSSLLEAITYALYGWSTWSGQAGDLISDHAATMTVELTFRAGGRRWTVTRSMSRAAYPAPVHRLECLDEPRRVDGKGAVTQAVQDLLGGLDVYGFLRTVILPQGRFARLLTATKAERDLVLKNIFRVDELEEIRERARSLLEDLRPKLDRLRVLRAGFLDDPEAREREAATRAARAGERERALAAAALAVDEAEASARAAGSEAASLLETAGGLAPGEIAAAAGELGSVAAEAAGLDRDLERAEAGRDRLRGEVEAGRARLAEMERARGDVGALTAAQATLAALAKDVEDLLLAMGDHDRRAEELTAAEQELAARERDRRATEEAEARASRATRAARDAEAERRARHDAVRESVRAALAARDRVRQVDEGVRREASALAGLERRAEEAARSLRSAETGLAEVERMARERRREHAAAHAAAGLAPGDRCPVCARALPKGFRPPDEPELGEAERAERAAHEAVLRAQKALAGTAAELDQGRRSARRARRESDAARVGLTAALASLGASIEGPDAVDGAAPVQEALLDGDVLGPFESGLAEARAAAERLEAEAAQAVRRSAEAAARFAQAGQALDRVRAELERAETACDRALGRISKHLAELPPDLHPAFPAAGPGQSPTDRAVLERFDVSGPVRAVEERLRELKEARQAVDALAREHDAALDALSALQATRRDRVEWPARRAMGVLDRASARVAAAASRLGRDQVPEAPDRGDLQACAAWGGDLLAAATSLAAEATDRAEEAGRRRTEAEARTLQVLRDAGVEDRERLRQAQVGALADRTVAERDLEEARRQLPMVRDLQDRIGRGERFLDAVVRVRELLLDGAFIGEFITRRQRSLLGVATTILGEMTRGRFAFSPEFDVIDRWSGQPRSPRTLSGGESFLASLALALAMVELAARAGGRLEALFLDEGFGALDASSLDAALDALEERSMSGRLVAVISHVRAVAERIPNVLAVTGSATGSTVAWLGQRERLALVQGDLSDAMTGLLG
jgi:DNA repair protein SbcC/Rad50